MKLLSIALQPASDNIMRKSVESPSEEWSYKKVNLGTQKKIIPIGLFIENAKGTSDKKCFDMREYDFVTPKRKDDFLRKKK